MTQEQWNMLQAIDSVLTNWTKSRFFSAIRPHEKERIVWLCSEFGLPPINFGCSGCIKSRLNSLSNIYENAKREREKTQ